jgi:uncharacterized membrane protein YtjA (UPF0391 family)
MTIRDEAALKRRRARQPIPRRPSGFGAVLQRNLNDSPGTGLQRAAAAASVACMFSPRLAGSKTQEPEPNRSTAMLKLALMFLVIGLIAGALGFTGVAGAAVGIAQVIFWIGIALFLIFLVLMALGINSMR